MTEYAVILKNVSKTFYFNKISIFSSKTKLKKIKSTNNISLKIEKGRMIGLIGKNGSGKTTLLRLISGIIKPDEGTIETNGRIGPLLQVGAGTNEELTVAENVVMQGILLGFKKNWIKEKVESILEFAELEAYRNVRMKHLSSGMKVRMTFSTALLMDPDILLVDEIISVGDEAFRKKSFDAFLSFKKQHKTIIFVSHNLQIVKELCDEVYFLDKGNIVDFGEPEKVIKAYQQNNIK